MESGNIDKHQQQVLHNKTQRDLLSTYVRECFRRIEIGQPRLFLLNKPNGDLYLFYENLGLVILNDTEVRPCGEITCNGDGYFNPQGLQVFYCENDKRRRSNISNKAAIVPSFLSWYHHARAEDIVKSKPTDDDRVFWSQDVLLEDHSLGPFGYGPLLMTLCSKRFIPGSMTDVKAIVVDPHLP
ncbi:hypothetical protein HDU76_010371, partial [Blyttiomyces sp. JEL0837]